MENEKKASAEEFPLGVSADLPLTVKDAWLLIETIDVRLQLLRHCRAIQDERQMFYYGAVEAELERQRDMIVQAIQPLIRLLPTPVRAIRAEELEELTERF